MPESTSIDTTQNTSYTVTLFEDGEDLILPIPDAIMNQLGWNDETIIEWDVNEDDNTIVLRKVVEE
jgi:bifunctional DNA-binding transcriptional regulator/antitoxin component of YhaV-PrlF toxin-antitoxin module